MSNKGDRDPWKRGSFWLRPTLAVAMLSLLAALYWVYDLHQVAIAAQASAEEFKAALTLAQADFKKDQSEKELLSNICAMGSFLIH
jgi:hypothetical protein